MDYDEILDQAIEMLQRRGRLTYRSLKRQFQLDDETLEDLTFELVEGQRIATDENGTVLIWGGSAESGQASASSTSEPPTPQTTEPERAPASYTPAYLAEKILTTKTSLEGERKQVTILFADIKDSTELIRDLDPEDAQKLLDPAIHIMMESVHRFEGTVNQVLGDGIMSIFGAPIAHEDHAARACYAALAMQSAMSDYTDDVRRKQGLELRIRVGLNSGEVVVRTIGNDLHMDYSAVGPTTHLAARMEQLASPGSIRLSSSTLRLVEGLVQVNDLGPIPVKGLDEPVEVYELTGASTVRRRLQAAVARGLTKFVGRDTEIDALNQALEQAGSGHGQIIAAVGEAGVGKSRLVYEFVHSHHTRGWLVLESASVSYGKATPYFPVMDLLKRYTHVEDSDDARTIQAKVTGQILTLDETLQETIPALLSLLDALPEDSPFSQLDPPQRRQRTLDGLKRILLQESQVQPLVLVFEDLHWHDSESQALLDSLVESLPTAQLLLLVNYRPEYTHSWGSKTYYTQLRLDPLPPESADEFLEALLGEDASLEPLKKLLIERTEGNPFFLEESVRTLVETQVLVGEPGTYRLIQDLPSIQVPGTVQAILAARIDRLPEDAKRLLQTAAVIGTEVPFALLQAIAEMSEDALHHSLTHLQSVEFLYETSLFPERVYTFKHALTHEVSYGSLLQERRRVLHARIVEALETFAGDRLAEQVERLAHHALRGEMWDKAVIYSRQAGEKALGSSAYREAVSCFEQGLDAIEHLPVSHDTQQEAIDLRLGVRSALTPLEDCESILEHLQAAKSLAEFLDDSYRLGRILGFMSHHFALVGEFEQAIATAHRALTLVTPHNDLDGHVFIKALVGRLYYRIGNYRQALETLRPTMAIIQKEQLNPYSGTAVLQSVVACSWSAMSHAELGIFAEGRAIGEESVRIAESMDHHFNLIVAYHGAGALSLRQGDIDQAVRILERSYAICKTTQNTFLASLVTSLLSSAYAHAGCATEALSLLHQMVERTASVQPMIDQAMLITELSEGYLLVGHVEEAHRLTERALALAQDRKQRGIQARALRLLGEVAMHRNSSKVKQAKMHYQQALALADELGMRPLQSHCHRGLGKLYSQTGQSEQARAELSTAIDMYRDMEMTFWLPETEAALASVEGA